MSKSVIITGATGLIGRKLVQALSCRGDNIKIFSRDLAKAKSISPTGVECVQWNYLFPDRWRSKLENTDAIIHLAGINLFSQRWNKKFKNEIIKSRSESTKNLVEAIKSCNKKPEVFISASGIGYYGDGVDNILDEESSAGNDFLADVCKVWENESAKVEEAKVRSIQIRTGLVLSKEDGAFKQMLSPFKLFVGGSLGTGKQWVSWLHINDIVGIYLHAIDNPRLAGAVNAASPNPVIMKDFAKILGKVLRRPSFFSVPKFVLKLVVGEAADIVTASQKVDVSKLLQSGYKFKFENLEEAFTDLLK